MVLQLTASLPMRINDNVERSNETRMTTRSVSLRKSELDQLLRLKGDSFNLSGFVREAIRRELEREHEVAGTREHGATRPFSG